MTCEDNQEQRRIWNNPLIVHHATSDIVLPPIIETTIFWISILIQSGPIWPIRPAKPSQIRWFIEPNLITAIRSYFWQTPLGQEHSPMSHCMRTFSSDGNIPLLLSAIKHSKCGTNWGTVTVYTVRDAMLQRLISWRIYLEWIVVLSTLFVHCGSPRVTNRHQFTNKGNQVSPNR